MINLTSLRKFAKRTTEAIHPGKKFLLPAIFIAGLFSGIGFYTIYSANALSYLSDKPQTCSNCHVMKTVYAGWMHGNHRHVTVCNDCHVPHDTIFRKYLFKTMDGMRHSTIFTARLEPQVIRIKSAGRKVVQENCLRCHERTMSQVMKIETKNKECWSCHRDTPHGRINSLSAAPSALTPRLRPLIPRNFINRSKKK